MEYSYDHHKEIKSGSVEGERSFIYYSEPMDILKKEDRDLLLEALVRMTNTVDTWDCFAIKIETMGTRAVKVSWRWIKL